MKRSRIPERGDIYWVTLNPTAGREQQGDPRPILVLTPAAFNRITPPLCAPITQGGELARVEGFAVTLTGAGTKTQGAVVVSQVRALDLVARDARFIEAVPAVVIEDALLRLQGIFEINE